MHERIKAVRKACNLSQTDFGERLGVSRDVISNIELNRAEIKDPLIRLLCKEFQVDYLWLRTGEGGMFFESDEVSETLDRIEQALEGESEFAKKVFKMFSKYSYEDWERLYEVMKKSKEYLREIEMSDSDIKKED